MLAFRSEAHVERWCEQRGAEPGAIFSLDRLWGLARAWYSDRLSPEWRRAQLTVRFGEVAMPVNPSLASSRNW